MHPADGGGSWPAHRGPHGVLRICCQMRSRSWPNTLGCHHLVGARPRQRDLDVVDDAAGPRRHHQHLVGEVDRLGQAVRDEHDRLAAWSTRCAAARGPWSCASARRGRRTARPSAAPADPAPGRARSRRAASCRPTARADSARRSPRDRPGSAWPASGAGAPRAACRAGSRETRCCRASRARETGSPPGR